MAKIMNDFGKNIIYRYRHRYRISGVFRVPLKAKIRLQLFMELYVLSLNTTNLNSHFQQETWFTKLSLHIKFSCEVVAIGSLCATNSSPHSKQWSPNTFRTTNCHSIFKFLSFVTPIWHKFGIFTRWFYRWGRNCS